MVLKFQIGSTEADLKRYKKIIKKSKGAKTFTAAEHRFSGFCRTSVRYLQVLLCWQL